MSGRTKGYGPMKDGAYDPSRDGAENADFYLFDFIRHCAKRGVDHRPPASDEAILDWLRATGDSKFWAVRNRLTSLSQYHRASGFPSPRVRPAISAYLASLKTPRTHRASHVESSSSPQLAPRLVRAECVTERLPARLEAQRRRVAALFNESLSLETVKHYTYDIAKFARWCAGKDLSPLPALEDTIVEFLFTPELSFSTVRNRLSAIAYHHRMNGHDDPARLPKVRELLKALRKRRPPQPKTVLMASDIRRIAALLGDQPLDVRDLALVLVTFCGALRVSQSRALDRSRIEFRNATAVLRDAEDNAFVVGRGARDETCPVQALERWLAIIGTSPGPLFPSIAQRGGFSSEALSKQAIRQVVFGLALRAGIDPKRITTKSLRSGFLLSAAAAGVPTSAILKQSRLKNLTSLLEHAKNVGEPYELYVESRRDRRASRARRQS